MGEFPLETHQAADDERYEQTQADTHQVLRVRNRLCQLGETTAFQHASPPVNGGATWPRCACAPATSFLTVSATAIWAARSDSAGRYAFRRARAPPNQPSVCGYGAIGGL